jgi:hypothetical protein
VIDAQTIGRALLFDGSKSAESIRIRAMKRDSPW